MLDAIRRFMISADFYKSLTFIVAALVPIFVSEFVFHNPKIGFVLTLGVIYNSQTNSPGSIKHRTLGMCVSIIITTLATLIVSYSAFTIWLLLPVLGVLTFLTSYISVYGFRASLVSLSGLLAIVLSFANSYVHLSVIDYTFLVFVGGLWYLLVSSLANYLNPKMYIEELLSDTMSLTGLYLETRSKLLIEQNNRELLNTELFKLQSELSEKHETLRDVILTSRQKSGLSNRIRRKLLLFIELVDMLELAIANPVNYEKVDEIFSDKSELILPFASLIKEMASHLKFISRVILRDEKVKSNTKFSNLFEEIKRSVKAYEEMLGDNANDEGVTILTHLHDYQKTQVQKIISIERVLNEFTSNNSLSKESKGDIRFLTPQDYGWNKLVVNFSLKSTIFRHSLRLSIAMLIGYIIGYAFELQNSYWILITIVVIMRPNYGLTIARLKHRIIGTFIGAIIGLLLVYLVQSTTVLAVFAATSLVLASALVHLNYRIFAVFMTLHIVFMYAIYSPNVLDAIQFRIIDTVIGGGVSILANLFLFPSWEFMTVKDSIKETLKANTLYLNNIEKICLDTESNLTEYKLSRKRSFLGMGDLNSAFQRMTQEPKSRQKYFSEIYDIVVLANTFLSSLASLGTYIKNHETYIRTEEFSGMVEKIIENLEYAGDLFEENKHLYIQGKDTFETIKTSLLEKIEQITTKDLGEGDNEKTIRKIQETKLILEQISFLFSLSKNLIQKISVYQECLKSSN